MRPGGNLHLLPLPECPETELQQPAGLFLLPGNEAYDVFVQPFRNELLLHPGLKTVLIFAGSKLFYYFVTLFHKFRKYSNFENIPAARQAEFSAGS